MKSTFGLEAATRKLYMLTGSFSHNIIYKGRIKAGLHCYFGDSWKKKYIPLYLYILYKPKVLLQ